MQRSDDNDALLTFSDKATGITWEIVRVDKNDIFTAVNSSKLVKYNANVYEKASLKNVALLQDYRQQALHYRVLRCDRQKGDRP